MKPTTQVCVNCCLAIKENDFVFGYEVGCMDVNLKVITGKEINKKTNNELWTVKDLIEALSKFPKDMPVAISLPFNFDFGRVCRVYTYKSTLYQGKLYEDALEEDDETSEIDVVVVGQ